MSSPCTTALHCLPLPVAACGLIAPPLIPCTPLPSLHLECTDDDATGARLQRKLHEWQERLAAAARLRESGGRTSAGFGSSQSVGECSPGASSPSDGLASRVRAAINSAGAAAADVAEAADSPRSSADAVSAVSELDFHSAASSAAPSPEKGGPLAPASASKPPPPGPGSPRIASAWLKGVQASAADEPGAEADVGASGAGNGDAPAPGSRIKQMGLQAAGQAAAATAAPGATQQAAPAQRGRKHRGGRRK